MKKDYLVCYFHLDQKLKAHLLHVSPCFQSAALIQLGSALANVLKKGSDYQS